MKMRYSVGLCLTILLLLTTHLCDAQVLTDAVYLKNGAIVKGTIIEQVPGKTIKVKTPDSLTVEISYTDIARIVKEPVTDHPSIEHAAYNNRQDRPKQYFFNGGAGFYAGDGIGYLASGGVGLRIGRQFSLAFLFQRFIPADRLTAGATRARYGQTDLRNYILKGMYALPGPACVRPYFGLGAGYSSSPHTSGKQRQGNVTSYGYYDSFLFNTSAGVAFPVSRNTKLFTELNYNLHRWTNVFDPGNQFSKPFDYANFITLTTGVQF